MNSIKNYIPFISHLLSFVYMCVTSKSKILFLRNTIGPGVYGGNKTSLGVKEFI